MIRPFSSQKRPAPVQSIITTGPEVKRERRGDSQKNIEHVMLQFRRNIQCDRVIRFVHLVAGYAKRDTDSLIVLNKKSAYARKDDEQAASEFENEVDDPFQDNTEKALQAEKQNTLFMKSSRPRVVDYEFAPVLYSPWYEVMEEVKKAMEEKSRASFHAQREGEMKTRGLDSSDEIIHSEHCLFENSGYS